MNIYNAIISIGCLILSITVIILVNDTKKLNDDISELKYKRLVLDKEIDNMRYSEKDLSDELKTLKETVKKNEDILINNSLFIYAISPVELQRARERFDRDKLVKSIYKGE